MSMAGDRQSLIGACRAAGGVLKIGTDRNYAVFYKQQTLPYHTAITCSPAVLQGSRYSYFMQYSSMFPACTFY